MEILSPIKNLQNAKIAIKKGANALYLASPNFGARVNASMDFNEISQIIELANSHKVKTYLTFNTIVFEDELDEFFTQIEQIYLLNASGIILQDFSFIELIKELYPELEVHCSTQMHIHNSQATTLVQNLGSNRIVVPREMNFSRIKKIKENTNIDIEAFVHGALCVCYSGQCYDSTLLDQKSANRGRCSQYCRMPQNVIHKRKNNIVSKGTYPLNLKDLNNVDNIDLYKKSGVNSLKIEGRLKGIDYVGLTTSSYYSKLNDTNNKNSLLALENVYNRTFTTGRINNINGKQLVNLFRPNNNGINIGTVKKVNKNTNKNLAFYKYIIEIKLISTHNIIKGDNLRFTYKELEYGQQVEQFEKISNSSYLVYTNEEVQKDFTVFKTKNNKLIKTFEEEIKDINIIKDKIVVDLYLSKEFITYSFTTGKEYTFSSKITLENAINKPLIEQDIITNLKKTNNTTFEIVINSLYLEDNSFLPVKYIKLLRDEIISNYKDKTQLIKNKVKFSDILESNKIYPTKNSNPNKKYYINCKTLNQLLFFNNDNRLLDLNLQILVDFQLAKQLIGEPSNLLKSIAEKYKLFLTLPKVIYDDENEEVLDIISHFDNLCISELGSLKYKKYINGEIISNFTLNTTNSININKLNELGVEKQILSIELNKDKINQLSFDSSIVNIYGRIPVMIMDYCPINMEKENTCGPCIKCRNNDYYIKDKLNRKFPLVYEGNNRIGLYTNEPLSLFNNLDEMSNINNYFLNLTFEEEVDLNLLIDSIRYQKNFIKGSFAGNFYKLTL